jgi:hypothetical protein
MQLIYNGIKYISGQYYLELTNDLEKSVRIPIDKHLAAHIKLYVGKICPAITDPVERGNEEESD